MRVILALAAVVTAGILVSAADAPPPWAYGFAGPAPATPPAARRSGSPADVPAVLPPPRRRLTNR